MKIGRSPMTRGSTMPLNIDSARADFLCLTLSPRFVRRAMFFVSERLKKAAQFASLLEIAVTRAVEPLAGYSVVMTYWPPFLAYGAPPQ
jgi:hypothetical protein